MSVSDSERRWWYLTGRSDYELRRLLERLERQPGCPWHPDAEKDVRHLVTQRESEQSVVMMAACMAAMS